MTYKEKAEQLLKNKYGYLSTNEVGVFSLIDEMRVGKEDQTEEAKLNPVEEIATEVKEQTTTPADVAGPVKQETTTPADIDEEEEPYEENEVDSDEDESEQEIDEDTIHQSASQAKDSVLKYIDEFIENPEDTVEILIMLIEVARSWALPFGAQFILFNKEERQRIPELLFRFRGTIPLDASDDDKQLLLKIDVLRKYENKLQYSEKQKQLITRILLRRAKKIKQDSILAKNDIFFLLAGIELIKFTPILKNKFSGFSL